MPREAPVTRAVLPVRVGMIIVLVVAAADNVTAFDPHTWSGPGILMVFGFRSARSDMAYSFNLALGARGSPTSGKLRVQEQRSVPHKQLGILELRAVIGVGVDD